jgi:hypothetical protein
MKNLGNTVKDVINNTKELDLQLFFKIGLFKTYRGIDEDLIYNLLNGFIFELENKEEVEKFINENKFNEVDDMVEVLILPCFLKEHTAVIKSESRISENNVNVFIIPKNFENDYIVKERIKFEEKENKYQKQKHIIDTVEEFLLLEMSLPLKKYLFSLLRNFNFNLNSKLRLIFGGNIILINTKELLDHFSEDFHVQINIKSELENSFNIVKEFEDYLFMMLITNNSGGDIYLIKKELINAN